MGLLSSLKSILPPSSRSFHALYGAFVDMRNDLTWRIHELNDVAGDLSKRMRNIEAALDAQDTHMQMFAWELLRKDGEDQADTKKRFFAGFPAATGALRMLQLGNAQLLGELDRLCRENDLRYWIDFGTLIGAVRHKGFIPWDDDMDVCMMRGDIRKLMGVVKGSDRHRVTVVFDGYAHCRQVRFCYADLQIPCFIDLFIVDYSKKAGHASYDEMLADRRGMLDRMKADERLADWQKCAPLIDADAPQAQMVARYFDDAVADELAADGFLTLEESEAQALVWGVDNMDCYEGCDWVFPLDAVFPTGRTMFEGTECNAPADPSLLLRRSYGDIYSLPNDINSHFSHVDLNECDESAHSWSIPPQAL